MLVVKFIVLFGCISVLSALQTYYCEICSDHSLCQYRRAGPSPACKFYDKTALLSKQEVTDIVDKINERRNYVATGLSKVLPQAANMKKIHWSTELAHIAQRWADQCDPSVRPDKEDDCRDLINTTVGQNIGSVVGPSPGLNVKSFVETWFIQILDYAGTVTYYNQTRDYKTKYFTQIIWAETEFVGCGKVKFYINDKKVMVERLVCNFAPKGNIHSKPVYVIGYAGTQCAKNTVVDDHYKGLCSYKNSTLLRKLTTQRSSVNSLLRILNLSNSSFVQEIDPVRNNLRQSNIKQKRQRNQKTRHVLPNYDAARRAPVHKQNIKKSLVHVNMSRNMNEDDYHFQHERGHSRLYHGFSDHTRQDSLPLSNYPTPYYFQSNNDENDFRRYHYTTTPVYLISSLDYRKYQGDNDCSRTEGGASSYCCNNYQCTRGHYHCSQTVNCQNQITTSPTTSINSCQCSTTCPTMCQTTCTPPKIDNYNRNCKCRFEGSSDNFQAFNNMPKMVRSGNEETTQDIIPSKEETELFSGGKVSKIIHDKNKNSRFYKKEEDDIHSKHYIQDRDYMYHSFDSSFIRKRRNPDGEITIKPFWKMNELTYKKTPNAKKLKYTTLTNRRIRKTRRNMHSSLRPLVTEPITLRKEDYADVVSDYEEQTTEKYLSFDELMFLRKFRDNYMDVLSARRQAKATSKKSSKNSSKSSSKNGTKSSSKKKTTNETKSSSKDKNKSSSKDKNKSSSKNKTKDTSKNSTKSSSKNSTKSSSKNSTKGSSKGNSTKDSSKGNSTKGSSKGNSTKGSSKGNSTKDSSKGNSTKDSSKSKSKSTTKATDTTKTKTEAKATTTTPHEEYEDTEESIETTETTNKSASKNKDSEKTKTPKTTIHTTGNSRKTRDTTKTIHTTDRTTETTTRTYTRGTTFIRKKHCTRKLTCTWTAFTGTDKDGSQLGPIVDYGSRTPPGYVDGCTRTATCTRDYLERNINATKSKSNAGGGSSGGGGGSRGSGWSRGSGGGGGGSGGGGNGASGGTGNEGGDEDYCEKRSLEIHRRNADFNIRDATTSNSSQAYRELDKINIGSTTSHPKIDNCNCNYNIRIKRHQKTSAIDDLRVMSYSDLYYLVLNKIINTNTATTKKCPCNCASSINFLFIVLSLMFHLICIL